MCLLVSISFLVSLFLCFNYYIYLFVCLLTHTLTYCMYFVCSKAPQSHRAEHRHLLRPRPLHLRRLLRHLAPRQKDRPFLQPRGLDQVKSSVAQSKATFRFDREYDLLAFKIVMLTTRFSAVFVVNRRTAAIFDLSTILQLLLKLREQTNIKPILLMQMTIRRKIYCL